MMSSAATPLTMNRKSANEPKYSWECITCAVTFRTREKRIVFLRAVSSSHLIAAHKCSSKGQRLGFHCLR